MKPINKKKGLFLPIACIIIQNLIFSLGNPLAKIANTEMGTFWCPAVRFLLAAAVMALVFGRRIFSALRRVSWKKWLPSSLCLATSFVLFNLSIMYASVTAASFVNSLSVLITPAMASLFHGRKYRIAAVPFQLAAIAGLFLLCCNGSAFSFGAGELCALLSAGCTSGALVFAQRALDEVDPLAITGTQLFCTAAAFTILAVFLDDVHGVFTAGVSAWLVVLYLGVGCSCLAYFLQNAALGRLHAGSVSMLQSLQTVMTAFFSYLLLDERLTPAGLAGAALITAAVLCSSLLDIRANRKAAAQPQK